MTDPSASSESEYETVSSESEDDSEGSSGNPDRLVQSLEAWKERLRDTVETEKVEAWKLVRRNTIDALRRIADYIENMNKE